MSWSVSAIGKAAAVAEKVASELERSKCSEPEETIKNTVADVVGVALRAFPPNYAVRVNASGSQQTPDFSKAPKEIVNSLNVSIEPIWGFVE
jgi:hypothetical protein